MRRMKCALAVAAACGGALFVVVGSEAASASAPARVTLAGTAAPSKARANHVGSVSNSSTVNFEVVLNLRDQAGAEALVQSISTPGSASYRQYLTAAQWEARFSPTQDQVNQVTSWLQSQGFSVGAVAKDRTTISASGTAAQVESAFSTSLQNYQVGGHTVRMASSDLSVPSSLSGVVAGDYGDQPECGHGSGRRRKRGPPGFGMPRACPPPSRASSRPRRRRSSPLRRAALTTGPTTKLSPPFGQGYPNTVPDVVCGYKPGQYRSAYGVDTEGHRGGRHGGDHRRVWLRDDRVRRAQVLQGQRPGQLVLRAPASPRWTQTPFDQQSACAMRAAGSSSRRSTSKPFTRWRLTPTSCTWARRTASTISCSRPSRT